MLNICCLLAQNIKKNIIHSFANRNDFHHFALSSLHYFTLHVIAIDKREQKSAGLFVLHFLIDNVHISSIFK